MPKLLPLNFQVNIPQIKREHTRQQELRIKTGGLGETEQRKRGIGHEGQGEEGLGRREIGRAGLKEESKKEWEKDRKDGT